MMAVDPRSIDPVYLPFTDEQLSECFDFVAGGNPGAHVARFRRSAARYQEAKVVSRRAPRLANQIEKDETFWTAATLLAFRHAPNTRSRWADLLARAFPSGPPFPEQPSWDDCLAGDLHLYLEVGLSSPSAYRDWLREHLDERMPIPNVRERGRTARRLEGRTHLDAMLIGDNLAVHFEAKVASDVDSKVTFDLRRNQIARNIDAMLEHPRGGRPPLSERDPDRSLFLLLTPKMFTGDEGRKSRLYGWLMHEYMTDATALARDLPHRQRDDWGSVRERLGWITWEDCNEILPGSCRWLRTEPAAPISSFIQNRLRNEGLEEVAAVEAARWLDAAGVLADSRSRPGLPLRNLLRDGAVEGAEQRPPRPHGRWFIRRVD